MMYTLKSNYSGLLLGTSGNTHAHVCYPVMKMQIFNVVLNTSVWFIYLLNDIK